ncbi:divergent polysaccharide deacetylase family protein [Alkalihalobacterium bogoriense]|uniref:divergent polysaccharide deacetylase family protein n=1 Tax=Alkalihalobacterium bogoriense TaxID=246272 RepID=UPI0005540E3B|nr:divergent polysaccharide deacetylase family protein [Alkalihalobacterium bogoriense]
MKRQWIILTTLLLCFFPLEGVFADDKQNHRVAIIIDDFGGDVKGVDSFFSSNIPITVAVMPFLEQSKQQATNAHELGFEVMVHLPLEPKKGKKSWLGPNPITSDLSIEEVKKRVHLAIDSVPFAVGLNNHMGSKIVEDEEITRAILEVAKERNLYVIDSGTSNKSYIPKVADELGIPWAVRDIFLDDTHSSSGHVTTQMKKLANIARHKGTAIGIGHVGVKGEETVKGIQNGLGYLTDHNIIIVPMSHLLDSEIEKNLEDFWHPRNKEVQS